MGTDSQLAELYREVILRHAANPVNHEADIAATHQADGVNPLCGDHVVMSLRVKAGIVEAAAFAGESCAICMASASLLCEAASGQASEKLCDVQAGFENALQTADDSECADYLQPMLGVLQYPSRINCALLPWRTMVRAIGTAEKNP